jgi:transposase
VLSRELQATPRVGGAREALRVLVATRRAAVDSRRVALQQLRAFVVTAPDQLRRELANLPEARLLARCARLRLHAHHDHADRALRLALRTCAQRALQARDETDMLDREITALVDELAPGIRDEPGVGPISAAQILIAWSHPGRIHSEAAFARIAGAAPIPATTGQTIRHRLDRGGDRQLNRALHTIVLSRRQRRDPATIAYIERRVAEGKTMREATRCLKRYTARRLYRRLNNIAISP